MARGHDGQKSEGEKSKDQKSKGQQSKGQKSGYTPNDVLHVATNKKKHEFICQKYCLLANQTNINA